MELLDASDSSGQPMSIEKRQKRSIEINRLNIKQDMIKAFSDCNILNDDIEINVINQRGEKEEGFGSGVYRDVLSIFWCEVYESLMIGEEERVPCIRHDYQRQEWEAIARVLVFGYKGYQYFPILLSKTFFAHCLLGENVITANMLLDSFRKYVSESERALIDQCLSGEIEVSDEKLLDFFSDFDCKVIIKESKLRQILEELSHKELIQKPQYIAECWRLVVCQLMPDFPSLESIDDLYNHLVATNDKVINALQVEFTNDVERECFKYLKRYIRGLDKSKLERFLKFTTGSELMLFHNLQIRFNQYEGASRRPVAHTCSCILEIPSTYTSFPELREEFTHILEANTWEIDIR